jgi:hypothetical protein
MSKQRRRGLGVKAIEKLKRGVADKLEIEAAVADEDFMRFNEEWSKSSEEIEKKGAAGTPDDLNLEARFKSAFFLGKSSGLAKGKCIVLGLFREAGF